MSAGRETNTARLLHTVHKHRSTVFQKPPSAHTVQAFAEVRDILTQAASVGRQCILDSCCGTAQSTMHLAVHNPDALVLGIDRSAVRLEAAPNLPSNAIVLRAECADFWELCARNSLRFDYHSIYYPNPYPKSEHLMRRWYAHPAFPAAMRISSSLEVRSNMQWYVQECAVVLGDYGVQARAEQFVPDSPITAFEKKYAEAGHTLWRVRGDIPGKKS